MRADRFFDIPAISAGAPSARVNLDVLQKHIGFAAHRAMLVLLREFVAATGGVRPVTFNAMVLIGANPGITQSDLASTLMLDKGTAAHLLSDLEKQGWIERRARLNDRRWKGVYLSPSGVEEVARLKGAIRELEVRFHTLFTPDEHRQLIELLNRISDVVEFQEEQP
jgi:DNA-binding MarR family transcriptional regulator